MSVNGLLIFCWINVLIQENRACEPNLVKLQSCNTRLQKNYERTSDAEIKVSKMRTMPPLKTHGPPSEVGAIRPRNGSLRFDSTTPEVLCPIFQSTKFYFPHPPSPLYATVFYLTKRWTRPAGRNSARTKYEVLGQPGTIRTRLENF